MKYKLFFTIFFSLVMNMIWGQSAQVINPDGGTSLIDGLKVQVNTTGKLAVYRNNQTQYYKGYVWPDGATDGVQLKFRFDNGTTKNSQDASMTACSTTQAQQDGNDWTTSISGYVRSSILDSDGTAKLFYVTINFQYTYPNKYFFVDYYVRAPADLIVPQTVHLYLDHDAFILGDDASKGYISKNATGHFVGDYRDVGDRSSCNKNVENPLDPSSHGFKVQGEFRSYFTGDRLGRAKIDSDLKLSNTYNQTCLDDGIGVEFTIGPIHAGTIGARRVMHAYGDNKTEFDDIPVTDPIPPSGLSSPVVIDFASASFSENEGNDTHIANEIKITVSGGKLASDQICNFTVTGGSARENTDFSYVKGFTIPAGDYTTTPQTFTLNNFTIIGNEICQNDRTINIKIDSNICNDLIQAGTQGTTVYTILDDDKPTMDQPDNVIYCNESTTTEVVFSGNTLSGGTYDWTNSNTAIGLAARGTGNLPSFTTKNLTANPITATITVTPKQGTCSGVPKTFTITVRPMVVVGVLSGNPYVCSGSVPETIRSTVTTGGTGIFTYQWQSSLDNASWTNIIGATNAEYTPAIISQDTYFRRVSTDVCGTFNSTAYKISLVPQGIKFTWKPAATNNDWNNADNWTNSGGLTNAVPSICSEVHIPGNATKYPSLDNNTETTTLGTPKADKIVFHYGGQLAYPHNLTYNKAFIQYNWGYYNSIRTDGAQPSVNGDALLSAPFMKRDNWYMLAMPLKKMASGDFAMAGYPLTWQSNFIATNTPEVGPIMGDFSSPLATNDVDLSTLNNALAIKVAAYKTASSAVGYNNHKHLEELNGILELPFFENADVTSQHPGHLYDKYSKQSTFFSFDTKTLQKLNSPIGRMKRDSEAYRFIFENSDNIAPNIDVIGSTPLSVPGYELQFNSPYQRAIMIGNPFMSSINTQNFLDANSDLLEESAGYYVFSTTSQTWEQFIYSSDNNVGPLQAFVVTLADGESAGALKFPLEGTFALTGADYTGSSRISPSGQSLYVTIDVNDDDSSNYAILNAETRSSTVSDVKKIIYPEGHVIPEVFFVGEDNKDYNLLQVYNDDVKEIKLGVKTSDLKNEQVLRFDNTENFVAANGRPLFLIDKLLQTKQDLVKNKTYRFIQSKVDESSQYVNMERFALSFEENGTIDSMDDHDITIFYTSEGNLKIIANKGLIKYQVYNTLGQLVYESTDLAKIQVYEKNLNLNQGVYIVTAKDSLGKLSTKKIVVN